MSNADIRGRFVWHELMTTDTKAASAFYPKVTGWRSQPWDKDPSYTLWLSAKGPFGGVRTLPDAARPHGPSWLAYIGTPDVDACLQHAQKLGARVSMGATDIPDTGRMAVLADPQGAAFALFSAAGSAAGSGSATGPSDFSWHELTTSDVEAAIRFYGELFGWRELNKHDMGAMGTYHLIGPAGAAQPLIGMYQSPADKPMPTRWMCYAHVTDIDKSANAAKSGGGKVVHGPMEVPGGTWIAHCIDPQGAAFAVHADQRVTASAPAAQPSRPAPAAAPPKSPPPPPRPAAPAPKPAAPAPKPAAPAPKPAAPPTLSSPPSPSAPTVKPVAPKPAASPAPSTVTATPAPSSKPAAPHAAAAAKKVPAKKAPAKVAKKANKKKAGKKKAAVKKRAHKKAKGAKKKTRRAAAKRKVAKKRGKTSHRRSQRGGLAAARRVAVKQARSLIRRLRGRRHR
jgi:hypothetical protein